MGVINRVGSSAISLSARAKLSVVLKLEPRKGRVSIGMPGAISRLVRVVAPCGGDSGALLVSYKKFSSSLAHATVTFTSYIVIPSGSSLARHVNLVRFSKMLSRVDSVVKASVATRLCLYGIGPGGGGFPGLSTVLPSFGRLGLVGDHVSTHTRFRSIVRAKVKVARSIRKHCSTKNGRIVTLVRRVGRLVRGGGRWNISVKCPCDVL